MPAVFERDEATSYFYLYDRNLPDGKKILGAIDVSERLQKVSDTDIVIKWNIDETQVHLYIRDALIASFHSPNHNQSSA